MKKLYFVFLLLLSISFLQCNSDKPIDKPVAVKKKVKRKKVLSPLVKPPIPELDIPFQTIKINTVLGGIYRIEDSKGSLIYIPPNSFVDKNRKAIKSDVELSYREFHDAMDIYLSGIPMEYDASGMQKYFQTAGMFDVRATCKGQEVYLDSGKVIKVIFGSDTGGDDYHCFKLDETGTRNWHYVGETEAKGNREKQKLISSIGRKVKATKIPLSPGHFSFNYMSLLDVYLRDDEKEIIKNKKDKTIESRIKQYGVEWMNFYNYQTISFNGNNYLSSLMIWKKITDKNFPTWGNYAETKLTLKQGNVYELEFNMRGKPKYRYDIEAVMPLKSLLQFTPSYWKNEYNKAFAKAMEAEAEKLRTMADVYRSFQLNEFGIYNYDKLMKDTLHIQINAEVKFDKEVGDVSKLTICYVSGDGKSLVKFPNSLWTNITLIPDKGGKMFVLLPDNYLALLNTESYNKIPFNDLRQSVEKPNYTLEFTTVKKITSDNEIREIIMGKPSI